MTAFSDDGRHFPGRHASEERHSLLRAVGRLGSRGVGKIVGIAVGHDEDISREEIIAQGIVAEKDYIQLEDYTRKLFSKGTQLAAERGLILVDTKYEFGQRNGQILLMDEIHTPDSSRYFYAEGYEERQQKGEDQKQLSKEFVREWLIANDFMGKEGQVVPMMSDEWIDQISARYIELFEKVTGQPFQKRDYSHANATMEEAILHALANLK